MKRLTFLSIAESELGDAALYYEEQEKGLGKQFLDAVRAASERFRASPDLFNYYEKPIRSCKVGPFPYRLLYRELPDRVQVVAVFHLSRRPGSWKDRLS
jgi:toxin ParE1/3/4